MRPRPPKSILPYSGEESDEARMGPMFLPAPELVEWLTKTFIDDDAPLHNEEHAHLRVAHIGALWTNAPNSRNGRTIVGQAERGKAGGSMGKWQKAKLAMLSQQWFGLTEPDFVLTFDAGYAVACNDAAFCALVEHELTHCAQEQDEFGAPKFKGDSGMPVFTIKGHDVEEFVGIVRRYGAIDPQVAAMVAAAGETPLIPGASIASVCGTCVK